MLCVLALKHLAEICSVELNGATATKNVNVFPSVCHALNRYGVQLVSIVRIHDKLHALLNCTAGHWVRFHWSFTRVV